MDYYRPCSFANIQGYPHDLPNDSAMNKLPTFQGNNAMNAEAYIKKFNTSLQRYTHAAAYNHEDVRMKLFVLSLEDEALDWFHDEPNNYFNSLQALIDAFKDKYVKAKIEDEIIRNLTQII